MVSPPRVRLASSTSGCRWVVAAGRAAVQSTSAQQHCSIPAELVGTDARVQLPGRGAATIGLAARHAAAFFLCAAWPSCCLPASLGSARQPWPPSTRGPLPLRLTLHTRRAARRSPHLATTRPPPLRQHRSGRRRRRPPRRLPRRSRGRRRPRRSCGASSQSGRSARGRRRRRRRR